MSEPYHELKYSNEPGFFDKSPEVRWAIGIIFCLGLFLFLHFRDVRVETLELDTVAPNFVVSQTDFDFVDDESTLIHRQEAVKEIGRIYQVSANEVRKKRSEFEHKLATTTDWRETADRSFEEIFNSIDQLERQLLLVRFTDPRTLHKMKEIGQPTENLQIYTPISLEQAVLLPSHIWQNLKLKVINANKALTGSVDYVIEQFQQETWLLEEDISAERLLRKAVQNEVPNKMTHVSAGNRIINQGEKVTPRHLTMLQSMKRALGEQRNLFHPLTLLGSLILTLVTTAICYGYFKTNQPKILSSNRRLAVVVTIVLMTLFIAKGTEFFLLESRGNLMEAVRYPLFVPFAAILLCSLVNSSVAAFASAFLTIILTISLSFESSEFMMINLIAALVAILSTKNLRRRQEIFVVCANAWLVSAIIIISIHFYQNTLWSMGLMFDLASAGLFMLLTAVLVVGLLPLFESVFQVMTDVTLMEYMDPNHELLKRLSLEAPGTYQHSIVVGNLAESAAQAIGANGLFCRVSTLYHDIGKMITPQYFTENQPFGVNIHQLLTPQESAQVIIAHVSEGVAMARKSGLPEQFIDVIKEHHGTSLVYYFFCKEVEKAGGDKAIVNESEFRYAGPKPRSKESALVMIADSFEAASRSLDKITEETLTELVNRLIREKMDDGQFDQCLLTFEELAVAKSTMVKTLVAFGHARIKYPQRKL